MKIIDRYLIYVVLTSTFLVLLVLLALDRLFAFIGQLDELDKAAYTFSDLLLETALGIPSSIYEMIATAALLGGLLGLGALANNSELTVVRSSGMSLSRIIRPITLVGVMLALLAFSLGEWVLPKTESYLAQRKQQASPDHVSLVGQSGLWLRQDDFFINIETILSNYNLRGVSVYYYSNGELVRIIEAAAAHYSGSGEWSLQKAKSTRLENNTMYIEDNVSIDALHLLDPALVANLTLAPEMLSASELSDNLQYLKENHLQTNTYELAFWLKFSSPLSIIVMLLIALPFTLGSQRVSSGGQRIFIGSLIGISYVLFSKVSSQLGLVVGLHGSVGAFFPVCLFTLLFIILFRRIS